MSRVCESANLIGPFNIPRSRSGYHPDVNKGEHFPGPEEDNPPIHVKGYTVPSEKAIRGLLLGTYRWETVLLHNDGTCSKYDVLHKERKSRYSIGLPLRKDIWNQVWVADCPGIDGHANTNLVVATNKTCAEGGFICWDFHTTNLKYSLIHSTKFNPDNAQSTSFNMHCHAVCGPLILYTSSGCSETKLFDIRDGEMQCIFPHKYLVQPMQYCSPISWMFETQIVLAHESTISIWDVQGQRSFPTMTFPTVLGSVRAIDMENSKAENVFNEARRRTYVPFEGVYCTDHAVYIVDKRAKAAISYRLPLNVESVTSIFCSGETILIGCSMFDYCVLQRTVYKVLQLSLRGGAKVTSYTIPTSDYLALNTPISQVWQDNKHILAVCGTGLYVFEQYPWKERSSIPVDDCAVIRLRSIIGPQHLEMPQFHAHNQRVLLTSGNHSPIWCEI